jgi:hypothetical protein
VFDNTLNNNIIFIELTKPMGFDTKEKKLYYINHILNLIAKVYLFSQDISDFQK